MVQEQISLLLGSGFSAPDGMKTVRQINDEISHLKVNDIFIHSDKTFILLKGQIKPKFSLHPTDELFFIEFIKFYIQHTKKPFNYEELFDFVTSYIRFGNHKGDIQTFFTSFKIMILKSSVDLFNIDSYIHRFIEYFNQLISKLLQSKKYYEDISLGNYPPYDDFALFLKSYLEDGNIVSVHSLNHDLLFEHLASKHVDLWQQYCDGFSDINSHYYGQVNIQQSISKTYTVRLKCFQELFDKRLRLYKLHGSVDTYIANIDNSNLDLTRIKRDWGVGELQKEINDGNTKPIYKSIYQSTYPDILSGASSKAIWYKQPHYEFLFNAFKINLKASKKLFVIGYGFKDDGINYILENDFLIDNKEMIVIDIINPVSRLMDFYKPKFLRKSITDLKLKDWLGLINPKTSTHD